MSEFGPAQLDAIEDALEDLELGVPPEAGVAGGPEVARRLDEYREILQWTRDAMPLREVTPGLLDGVLEEARSVEPVVAPTDAREPSTSWWKRLRGAFLLPAVAVAGSAALVLLFVRAGEESGSEATLARAEELSSPPAAAQTRSNTAAADAPADGRPAGTLQSGLADASVDQDLSRGRLRLSDDEAVRGGAADNPADAVELEEAEAAPKVPAEPPPPPPARPAPARNQRADDKVIYDEGGGAKQKQSGGAAPGRSSAPSAPKGSAGPVPEPEAAKPEQKKDTSKREADDPWGAVAAADKLRRAGACGSAKVRYKALLGSSDRRVRARALAGIGLCEAAEGNDGAADDFFGKARKEDPDIAGFIAHERAPKDESQADALEESL